MTFSHSKPLLVILSIILVAVLILGVYSIRFKNKETLELFNLVDEVAEKKTLLQSIEMMQDAAREDIKAFNEIVLSSDELVPLIESLETSGRALGIDVEILSVEEVKNTDSLGLQNIRIAIETQGSWPPTLSFLRVIESLPHRVLIDESSISKQGDLWRSRIVLSLHLFD